MLKEGYSLYFLAITPPIEVQQEISNFKHEITEKYGSCHALKSPPHITLHMPFRWKNKKYDQLVKVVRTINEEIEPIEIKLKDFDFFEPRVIFVNVIQSESLEMAQKNVVSTCRRKLNLDNANYRDRPFHPHITIGFRDLKKSAFYKAQKEFEMKKYSSAFRAKEVTLLKHDGNAWSIVDIHSPN